MAYTAVDLAEDEFQLANIVNGTTVTEIAKVAAKRNIPFLHISSDYVFNGNGSSSWKTNDPTNPQNSYGRSKLIGESGILAAAGPYVILRTSWVFSSHGNNFVKTMMRLMKERATLNVVSDQIGRPTYAKDLAIATIKIVNEVSDGKKIKGIYHFANKGVTSWFEFAQQIKKNAGLSCELNPINTTQFPTPAKRPAYSVLDTSKIEEALSLSIPHWEEALANCMKEINAN